MNLHERYWRSSLLLFFAVSLGVGLASTSVGAEEDVESIEKVTALQYMQAALGDSGGGESVQLWWLSFRESEGRFELKGGVDSAEAVAEGLERLHGSPHLAEVTLEYVQRRSGGESGDDWLEFRMVGRLEEERSDGEGEGPGLADEEMDDEGMEAAEIPRLLRQIQDAATEVGIRMTSFQPKESNQRGDYVMHPLQMDMEGSLEAMESFLARSGRFDRPLQVSKLRLQREAREDDEFRISLTLTAVQKR